MIVRAQVSLIDLHILRVAAHVLAMHMNLKLWILELAGHRQESVADLTLGQQGHSTFSKRRQRRAATFLKLLLSEKS